jgi:hypothetical protein
MLHVIVIGVMLIPVTEGVVNLNSIQIAKLKP